MTRLCCEPHHTPHHTLLLHCCYIAATLLLHCFYIAATLHSLRESLGISADSSTKAFPSLHIDKFFERKYDDIMHDSFDMEQSEHHIIVSVDPSGGGSSQFAVFSLVQLNTGQIMVSIAHPLPTFHVIPQSVLRRPQLIGNCNL